ncbi:MAG: hypothetical protein Q9219_007158 [cf. Caloplaca sp. 3 TL-2023]
MENHEVKSFVNTKGSCHQSQRKAGCTDEKMEAINGLQSHVRSANRSCSRPYSLLPAGTNLAEAIHTAIIECRVRPRDIEDIYPCSPLQAALMVMATKSPAAYICRYSYIVLPEIDIGRLRLAWNQLKLTEPVLRNRIIWNHSASGFLQVTVAHNGCDWDQDYFDRPMELGQDLCKANIVWDSQFHKWTFNIKVHHSLFDGRLLQLVLQRLEKIYISGTSNTGTSFTSFIQYLTPTDPSAHLQTQNFWTAYLGESSATSFPRPQIDSNFQANTNAFVSLPMTLDVQRLVQKYRVSPATCIYAAAAIVFGIDSSREDVCFGVTLSGRDTPIEGIDDMIGPTIATAPFRIQLNQNLELQEYMKVAQEQILSLTPYQHYGLQNIKRIGSGLETACNFRSLVVVQSNDPLGIECGLFERSPYQKFFDVDDIPLSMELILGGNQIMVNCGYDEAFITRSEVEIVASQLESVLQELLDQSPTSRLCTSRLAGKVQTLADFLQAGTNLDVHRTNQGNGVSHRQRGTSSNKNMIQDPHGHSLKSKATLEIERLFQEVFQTTGRLMRTDDFFQLGGDSFTAMHLVANARQRGYELSMRQVYQNPKLGDLAAVMTPQLEATSEQKTLPQHPDSQNFRREAAQLCYLPESEIEELYPASPFQESLAAISSRELGHSRDHSYMATIVLEIPKTTDPVGLTKALEAVLYRNPIFRTRFIQSSRGLMQVVCVRVSLVSGPKTELIRPIVEERPGRRPYAQFLNHLNTVNKAEAADFWTKQLVGLPVVPFPETPDAVDRPLAKSFLTYKDVIDVAKLRTCGVSVATIIAAAWALLLSSYCEIEDTCYAIVLSGRDKADLQDIMGPTLSTVPMRIALSRSEETSALLARTQNSLLGMQEYQHYGIENISKLPIEAPANAVKPASLLVLQLMDPQTNTGDGDDTPFKYIEDESYMFLDYPLAIVSSFASNTNELQLKAQFDERYLDPLQVGRMMRHLSHVIKQLSSSEGLVGQIEIITPEDKAEISGWNPFPRPRSPFLLHELIEQTVFREPERIAVASTLDSSALYRELTYQQLNDYATVLAGHITRNNQSSRFVGICISRSPLAVVSMIAVMKAGRAFVPLDPSFPTARIQTMLDNLKGEYLLVTDLVQSDRFQNLEKVVLDDQAPIFMWVKKGGEVTQLILHGKARSSESDHQAPIPRLSPAYVLHTSGSTGTPKGIIVSHSSSATALESINSSFGVTRGTRTLQYASFAFDAAVLEILGPLVAGGCVCMITESERLTGDLARAVRSLRANHLHITPTLASVLDPIEFPSIQTMVLIGEPPSKQVLRRCLQSPDLQVLNGYGPAECGFMSSMNASLSVDDPSNIGRPVGCQLFIETLSNPGTLAAIGAIGELVICGKNVADGYLMHDHATSAAFGEDPPWLEDSDKESTRFYRTGDLARYRSDGSIQSLGRRDLQKKIHGQRLELGEIEDRIIANSKFRGAVVELLGSSTLVAIVQIGESYDSYTGLLSPEAIEEGVIGRLVAALQSSLPSYMIPSVYVPVAALPTSPSGKADRRQLRSEVERVIDEYRHGRQRSKRAPENEKQALMRQLWAEAIPVEPEKIGIDDGFFSLGGTSIGVIRLIRATKKHHLQLDVAAVYQHSTLSDMAAALQVQHQPVPIDGPPQPFSLMDSQAKEHYLSIASIRCRVPRSAVLDVYPCSPMQGAMMMFSEKNPGSYFVQSVFQITEGTDLQKLTESVRGVRLRYDVLRTRIFLDEDFRSIQAVLQEPFDVPTLDEDVDTYMQSETAPRYGESLFRCAIVGSASSRYLVISQHHAIFDAWSLELLLSGITRLYSGASIDSLGHGGISSFIRHTLQIQESLQAAQYWQETLSGACPTPLPQARKATPVTCHEYQSTIQFRLSRNTSLAVLVEATWGILMGRYNGSEDVCPGVIRSGRTAEVEGIDETMGPTLASIPLRLRPIRDLSVTDYLKTVERSTSEASRWEQYGLSKIRNLNKNAADACHFQSMVITQHRPDKPPYDPASIPADDIRWITQYFCRLLSNVAANPGCLIKDLDMAGPETIRQTLDWNNYPIAKCTRRIEELFHERAGEWSSLTAVAAVDATLTYQDLDCLSTALAESLRASGLCRGDLVPLCMEKSAIMIIAILGVLKAGAGYVPLEIDHPFERMKHIIQEVHARVILCTPRQEQLCQRLDLPLLALDMDLVKFGGLNPKL